MKFISLIFVCCLGFVSSTFAEIYHVQAHANGPENKFSQKDTKLFGYCEIQVINQSYDDVRVFGTFDDGSKLDAYPFYAYRYGAPQTIDLYDIYQGVCYGRIHLYIETLSGYPVYQGYVYIQDSPVRIVPAPYLNNQVKVQMQTK